MKDNEKKLKELQEQIKQLETKVEELQTQNSSYRIQLGIDPDPLTSLEIGNVFCSGNYCYIPPKEGISVANSSYAITRAGFILLQSYHTFADSRGITASEIWKLRGIGPRLFAIIIVILKHYGIAVDTSNEKKSVLKMIENTESEIIFND